MTKDLEARRTAALHVLAAVVNKPVAYEVCRRQACGEDDISDLLEDLATGSLGERVLMATMAALMDYTLPHQPRISTAVGMLDDRFGSALAEALAIWHAPPG